MFKRSILDDLGGVLFYDHFKSYYEDVDFCHRVWLTGNEVHFVDTPYIDHLQGITANKLGREQLFYRLIRNKFFSQLTTFCKYELCTVFILTCLLHTAIFTRRVLILDSQITKAYRLALANLWHNRKEIKKTRLGVAQQSSKISFRQRRSVLKKIMGSRHE